MQPRTLILAVMLAGGALQSIFPAAALAQGEVAIIVNRSNDTSDMSLGEVRKLFMGEKGKWRNGQRVIVLMNSDATSEKSVVMRQIFRMKQNEYNKFAMQAAFTGRIQTAPREVDSVEMKKIVAETPGAVGYIRIQEVDTSVRAVLLIR